MLRLELLVSAKYQGIWACLFFPMGWVLQSQIKLETKVKGAYFQLDMSHVLKTDSGR